MSRFAALAELSPWLEVPDDVRAQATADPEALLPVPLSAEGLAPIDGGGMLALLDGDTVAAALFDADGRWLAGASAERLGWAGSGADARDLLVRAARSQAPIVCPLGAGDGSGGLLAAAPARLSAGWRLPAAVAAALPRHPDAVVVVTSHGSVGGRPLADACAAYGLTGLETRVVMATCRLGTIRAAAGALKISAQTARAAIGGAMAKIGSDRLPAMVARLAALSFGIVPDTADRDRLLADIWGISDRQAAIGALVADGLSRAEAAAALGLGEAVVKKELDRLYRTLGVGSSAALAQAMVAARAMQWLLRATAGGAGHFEERREPLRLLRRADGSQVAWSDYGPASGRPVLVVHSSLSTRFVGRRLLRALQGLGFRPIAIDRPGFGLTDPIAGQDVGAHDPFAAAVDDVWRVMDAMRVRRVDVVARGGAHLVLALARAAPERMGRVVLVNPDPHARSDGRRMGSFGAFKEAYIRRPAMVRLMARVAARQLSGDKPYAILARMLEGSPPDEAAMAQADIVEDFVRAIRPFGTGRYEGYVHEQVAHVSMTGPPAVLAGTRGWHILLGAHDTLYDPAHVARYWRTVLPEAGFTRLEDAGRLLAMTHAALVAGTLAALAGGSGKAGP